MSKLTLTETIGEVSHTYHIHINHLDNLLDKINFVEEVYQDIEVKEVGYGDAPKCVQHLIDGILEGKI